MPEIQFGASSLRAHGTKVFKLHIHDWAILLLLLAMVYGLNQLEPFHRFIAEDMMSNIKYPMKKNTIPTWAVPVYAVLFPMLIFLIYYIVRRDVYDLHHATLGIWYSAGLTGVITDAIKIAVGRPRPNFFYRCFPDGIATFNNVTHDVLCHGDEHEIREGYKSFPSGHTSWSFAGLVFLSWYMSGKIRAFNQGGHVAKLCIMFLPILFATLVGVSRIDDYWHHWQDVFAGAIIGTVISTFCYLQFFPYPHDKKGWAPHAYFKVLEERSRSQSNVQHHDMGMGSSCTGSDHVLIEISGAATTPSDTVPVPGDVDARRRSSQH